MISRIKEFLHLEAASGILLVVAAILAMLAQNSALDIYYQKLLDTPVIFQAGEFLIDKPLLLWINDGLMAIFFFLIGLELKRELLAGELSDPSKVVLPVIGAIGGMAVPAIIYAYINWGDPVALKGWAIPAATDIAFALGVLALLGSRVPQSLKLFLMTLAIIDDMGAIIIIALFYTSELSITSLLFGSIAVIMMLMLNRKGVISLTPYLILGVILWVAVLKSGVHATLAGVITALFIPFARQDGAKLTQLEKLETDLHPTVAFGILPLFAFANAGISLDGINLDSFLQPIPLGIALGLFFGNQIGIFGLCWLAIKSGIATLPSKVSWIQLYGTAMLCGIGFTMSLFIGSLAFEQAGSGYMTNDRLGIVAGSIASGLLGYIVLRFFSAGTETTEQQHKLAVAHANNE